jgi:GlpG protein
MRRRIKLDYNAPLILTFALLSGLSLALGYLTDFESTELLFMTYRSSLLNPLTYVRLFTHALGHADWEHYISNMSYILLLGPMMEEKYGSRKLLYMMLITAGITGVANTILFPRVALCGASGIVFLFIVLSSITSTERGEIPLTLILIMAIYLGGEVYDMIYATDNISHLAHIIGGCFGAYFGFRFLKESPDPRTY